MDRRQFLSATAAATSTLALAPRLLRSEEHAHKASRIYTSPADAMKSPREELAYVVGTYAGTKGKAQPADRMPAPDFLATVDLDPASAKFGQVIHRLPLPTPGDELHHFGWNACGSCHGERERRYLVVPGLVSSRIHIIDTADPKQPKLHK